MCALVTGVQTCALPIYRPLVVAGGGVAARRTGISARPPLRIGAASGRQRRDDDPDRHVRPCRRGRGRIDVERRTLYDRTQERRARGRSEEHTTELQSLMRNSYAVFCLKKKKSTQKNK